MTAIDNNLNGKLALITGFPKTGATQSQNHLAAQTRRQQRLAPLKSHPARGPAPRHPNLQRGVRIPSIADITIAKFDATLATNLRAAFILSKLALPHMQA
ncbi:hypothetical protein B0T25DRAFT_572615 [Lasiosphaeria hispida]|uniref:Uncharacterized protein n=1 Tax=Lasiosphaeria hispida TaxID=260671 RepID=A0AAJ0H886_9PEZI|nr:hypothetical protein B0T25DRAFT_572615 [Lasiosphaeria hispida]